jgi:hypothetical protein
MLSNLRVPVKGYSMSIEVTTTHGKVIVVPEGIGSFSAYAYDTNGNV